MGETGLPSSGCGCAHLWQARVDSSVAGGRRELVGRAGGLRWHSGIVATPVAWWLALQQAALAASGGVVWVNLCSLNCLTQSRAALQPALQETKKTWHQWREAEEELWLPQIPGEPRRPPQSCHTRLAGGSEGWAGVRRHAMTTPCVMVPSGRPLQSEPFVAPGASQRRSTHPCEPQCRKRESDLCAHECMSMRVQACSPSPGGGLCRAAQWLRGRAGRRPWAPGSRDLWLPHSTAQLQQLQHHQHPYARAVLQQATDPAAAMAMHRGWSAGWLEVQQACAACSPPHACSAKCKR